MHFTKLENSNPFSSYGPTKFQIWTHIGPKNGHFLCHKNRNICFQVAKLTKSNIPIRFSDQSKNIPLSRSKSGENGAILSNLLFFGQNLKFLKIAKIAEDLGKIMQTRSNLVQTFLRVSSKDLIYLFLNILILFSIYRQFCVEKGNFSPKITFFAQNWP